MNNKKCIDIGKGVIAKEAEAIASLRSKIDESFSKTVDAIYNANGRVIISGMGKSGIIGRKIASTLTSTGIAAFFLHPAESVHGDLGMVHKDDVVICISKSGDTHELTRIITTLKRIGCTIIALTGNRRSRLAQRSDIVMDVSVKEEACPNNLIPTSSSTAALVMGDAIAVALLEKRGFSSQDFALLHPGGSLGKILTISIDEVMFTGERLPLVNEDTILEKVIFEITSKRFGSACVVNNKGQLKGIITDGDIRRMLEKRKDIWNLHAREIMTKDPKTITEGELASRALKILTDYSIMQIVVVDENAKPQGIVHIHDLLEAGISQ